MRTQPLSLGIYIGQYPEVNVAEKDVHSVWRELGRHWPCI